MLIRQVTGWESVAAPTVYKAGQVLHASFTGGREEHHRASNVTTYRAGWHANDHSSEDLRHSGPRLQIRLPKVETFNSTVLSAARSTRKLSHKHPLHEICSLTFTMACLYDSETSASTPSISNKRHVKRALGRGALPLEMLRSSTRSKAQETQYMPESRKG